MRQVLIRCGLFALALLPATANADPAVLKLAFFGFDRSTTYLAAVEPFVDAVNAPSLQKSVGREPADRRQL
jgi:hypothetical protein